ncbi:hypothetical protein SEUCBS139899_010306 [Sporothrix eucalyptigena]|uniref:Leucine rich repeat domain containing protein n=1 Tax=Sporothrix eucalyptigena TaxID=1812306 RepID=A0ABP0CK87_9PEZI
MSNVPGSLKGIIKTGTFHQGALPNLRILKLRDRDLDEASLVPIAEYCRQRIWSLDLGQNKLTDSCVRKLLYLCFGVDDLTAQKGHHEVEGGLATVQDVPGVDIPPMWRGWFSYIVESSFSTTFTHPDRYLADSPVYDEGNQRQSRLTGNEPLRSDRVEDVKIALAGGPGQPVPDWHDVREADICKPPLSLTHVYLSGNQGFTMEGVESIFRFSRGHIQHFDCASPAIATNGQVPFALTGILGRSHLFRPVHASNLRSLRIHHSLVTHIPTLNDPSKNALMALKYAETVLHERAEMAYPQAFVPDLNPRLQSLTLTCLPRVSTGPLIDKLIRFLVSAADQEEAVRMQHSALPVSRRGPAMLRGLRHIRLEFEPCPPEDENVNGTFENLDAKALLNSSTDGFSFFGEASSAKTAAAKAEVQPKEGNGKSTGSGGNGSHRAGKNLEVPGSGGDIAAASPAPQDLLCTSKDAEDAVKAGQPDRLPHYPLPGALDADSEYVRERLSLGNQDSVNETTVQVSVWVGTGKRGPNRTMNRYMANLSRESLRTHIRPATPDQVEAGVPVGACIYNAAWDAILWLIDEDENGNGGDGERGTIPLSTSIAATQDRARQAPKQPSPRRQEHHGQGMRDVVDAIRQFRAETRTGYPQKGMAPTSPFDQQAGESQRQRRLQQQRQPAPRHWTGTLEVLLAS